MNPRRSSDSLHEVQQILTCPMCGGGDIATTWNDHTFTYGSGRFAADLTVHLPVRYCEICDFSHLDDDAEVIKHEAICQHLGVLPPTAIRNIRQTHRMARTKFSEITGLGEASLNRWENGLSIQSHANDRYLRLLADPYIMDRLQDLVNPSTVSEFDLVPIKERFRVLKVTENLLQERSGFRLYKAKAA